MSDPKAPNGKSRPPLFGEGADDFDFGAMEETSAVAGHAAHGDDFNFDDEPFGASDTPTAIDPAHVTGALLDPAALPEGTLDLSPFEETDEAAFLSAKRAEAAVKQPVAAPVALDDLDDLTAFDSLDEPPPDAATAAASPVDASFPSPASAKEAAFEASAVEEAPFEAFAFEEDEIADGEHDVAVAAEPVEPTAPSPATAAADALESLTEPAGESDPFADFSLEDEPAEPLDEPPSEGVPTTDSPAAPADAAGGDDEDPFAIMDLGGDEPDGMMAGETVAGSAFDDAEAPSPAMAEDPPEAGVSAWSVNALDAASQSAELEAMSRRAQAAAAAYRVNSDEPEFGPSLDAVDLDGMDISSHHAEDDDGDQHAFGDPDSDMESEDPGEPVVRKYMFDLSFDYVEPKPPEPAPEPMVEEAMAEPEPEPEPEPPPPMFGEEYVEAARQAAFDSGRAIGHADAHGSIEADRARALDALGAALPGMLAERAQLVEAVAREAARLAHAMTRRLMPALAERYGLIEIEQVVSTSLDKAIDQPRVIVRVTPALVETIATDLDRLATTKGFAGRITALGDASLGPADVRIDWGDGGAERMTRRLWGEIEHVVARAIGRINETIPDPSSGDGSLHDSARAADKMSGMGSAA